MSIGENYYNCKVSKCKNRGRKHVLDMNKQPTKATFVSCCSQEAQAMFNSDGECVFHGNMTADSCNFFERKSSLVVK